MATDYRANDFRNTEWWAQLNRAYGRSMAPTRFDAMEIRELHAREIADTLREMQAAIDEYVWASMGEANTAPDISDELWSDEHIQARRALAKAYERLYKLSAAGRRFEEIAAGKVPCDAHQEYSWTCPACVAATAAAPRAHADVPGPSDRGHLKPQPEQGRPIHG